MPTNMFDDCKLATTIDVFFQKIRSVLEDNFDVNTNFNCSFDEKPGFVMILDVSSGELSFRERRFNDKNEFNSKRVVAIHYFLQLAAWMIYNTLIDQRENLSLVLDNFYNYTFGPLVNSIVFNFDPQKNYTSELPRTYRDFMSIVVDKS